MRFQWKIKEKKEKLQRDTESGTAAEKKKRGRGGTRQSETLCPGAGGPQLKIRRGMDPSIPLLFRRRLWRYLE